jgi:hypothetical protein
VGSIAASYSSVGLHMYITTVFMSLGRVVLLG